MKAAAGMRSATVEATVTRADGTVENLGVVSYWHKNPLCRLAWRIRRAWRQLLASSALER